MELFFKIVMGIFLDAAMITLVLKLLKDEKSDKKGCRFQSGAFAVGFLIEVIINCFFEEINVLFSIYAFGFLLSYMAFVLTLPGKETMNEKH